MRRRWRVAFIAVLVLAGFATTGARALQAEEQPTLGYMVNGYCVTICSHGCDCSVLDPVIIR
jgi:hypothetical protein